MTKITIDRNPDRYSIIAIDHATGSKQVCAGISALLYTLEGYITNHPAYVKNHKSNLNSGNAWIEFEPLNEEVKAVFESVMIGLMQIEFTYSDKYIKVTEI